MLIIYSLTHQKKRKRISSNRWHETTIELILYGVASAIDISLLTEICNLNERKFFSRIVFLCKRHHPALHIFLSHGSFSCANTTMLHCIFSSHHSFCKPRHWLFPKLLFLYYLFFLFFFFEQFMFTSAFMLLGEICKIASQVENQTEKTGILWEKYINIVT